MILFHAIYSQPMNIVYIEMAAMYLIWLLFMLVLKEKPRRIISTICLVLAVIGILSFTLLNRSGGNTEISLMPFVFFSEMKIQPEIYRSMIMNVFLFMPFGLSLPFALPNRARHRVIITVLAGIILSVCVEATQLIFSLGKCETDDVIMNTLGTLISSSVFLLYMGINRLVNKRRKK